MLWFFWKPSGIGTHCKPLWKSRNCCRWPVAQAQPCQMAMRAKDSSEKCFRRVQWAHPMSPCCKPVASTFSEGTFVKGACGVRERILQNSEFWNLKFSKTAQLRGSIVTRKTNPRIGHIARPRFPDQIACSREDGQTNVIARSVIVKAALFGSGSPRCCSSSSTSTPHISAVLSSTRLHRCVYKWGLIKSVIGERKEKGGSMTQSRANPFKCSSSTLSTIAEFSYSSVYFTHSYWTWNMHYALSLR